MYLCSQTDSRIHFDFSFCFSSPTDSQGKRGSNCNAKGTMRSSLDESRRCCFPILVLITGVVLFVLAAAKRGLYPSPFSVKGASFVVEKDVEHSDNEASSYGDDESQITTINRPIEVTKGQVEMNDGPLFVVVADKRSGADHVMRILNQRDEICASGDYPTSALMNNDISWIENDSTEKGCTLAFIRKNIAQIVQDVPENETSPRCSADYNAANDELRPHLQRFCNMIAVLDGNYSAPAISNVFVDAFLNDPDNKYTGCSCPKAAVVKGLKVNADWISEEIPLETTAVHGAKIVRLTRRNLFERFMSINVAQKTNIWSIQSEQDKASQMEAYVNADNTIDIDYMLLQFEDMLYDDQNTDSWVKKNAGEILWIDYAHIRNNPAFAFERIYSFLGIDAAMDHYQTSAMIPYEGKALLQYIANAEEVIDVLRASGFGHFIGADNYPEVQHIIYNIASVRVTNNFRGLKVTVVGEGNKDAGPSARFNAALPFLRRMTPDNLVILSDVHSGGMNHHIRSMSTFYTELGKMRKHFEQLTHDHPGAIVVSASESVYLGGTFVAGKTRDMVKIIDALKIDAKDDDRAILTDYMHKNPDQIVIDYDRKMFGIGFEGVRSKVDHCSPIIDDEYFEMTTSPLLLQSSKNMSCSSNNTKLHFPAWDENGIKVKPILRHIDELLIDDVSLRGIQRYFGKEILYIIDDKGVWGSDVKRDKYRVKPTENFLAFVHKEVMETDARSPRWSKLQQLIQSSVGFPYFAWYGDWRSCNLKNSGEDSVPVFTTCAGTTCSHSFPMPAYMVSLSEGYLVV